MPAVQRWEDEAMCNGTVLQAVAIVGLVLAAAGIANAQTKDESFEEKLRKAVEAQTKKN
jgi:hypothetical protein